MKKSTNFRSLTNVKVFISSTFSDLDTERNYISQVIFNSLRNTYKELPINEIDLRWGITEEQANNGRVIDLCLQYIHEANPFFIGILGDRYGTVFSSKDVRLSPIVEEYFPEAYKDINNNLSATEIEIINGVLRNKEAKAIFFIKKDAKPYPGESKTQWTRLENLKKRVKESGHQIIEYTKLEDFDTIQQFIENHLGSPDNYVTPVEGLERADKIYRMHFERSLSYTKEVPYDPRLDRLLQMIDATVSQSTHHCAFIGLSGVGKSTTLSYMVHNFTGERIYVPIYGDIDELPSTQDDLYVFLKNALKNAMFKYRVKKSKWYQFKEWFRDGLKEIDYDSPTEVYKEALRHKWCFIIDNYESSEWPSYNGFGQTSLSKARLVYDRIFLMMVMVANKYNTSCDLRLMYVRDMDRECFDTYVNWSNEPIFDLDMNWWFQPEQYVPKFMSDHSKNLSPRQLKAIVKAPIHWLPGAIRMICQYMVEFVKYNEINTFLERVNQNTSIYLPFQLYIEKINESFNESVSLRTMMLLFIYRSGITLQEFEKHMSLSHIDFLFLMRLLSPFIVYTANGIRLKDHMSEYPIKQILGITDEMIRDYATQLSDRYQWELFDKSLARFMKIAKINFRQIAIYFDRLIPSPIYQQMFNLYYNSNWTFQHRNNLLSPEIINYRRLNYWMSVGDPTDELIIKAYNMMSAADKNEWVFQEETMSNYLLTSYVAKKTDRLMSTVHNPYFIRKMWNHPLYLLVWDSYLSSDGEFAAPYNPDYSREIYDMKALTQILNWIQNIFYLKVIEPMTNKLNAVESIKIEDLYLNKNYPKQDFK